MSRVVFCPFIGSVPVGVVSDIKQQQRRCISQIDEETLVSIECGKVQTEGQIIYYTRQRDSLRVVLEWLEETKDLEIERLAGKVKDSLEENKEKVGILKAQLESLPRKERQGSEVQAKLENQVALRNAWHKLVSTLGSSSVQEAREYLNKEIQYAEKALESHLGTLEKLNNRIIEFFITSYAIPLQSLPLLKKPIKAKPIKVSEFLNCLKFQSQQLLQSFRNILVS